jgi:hypothetical protein
MEFFNRWSKIVPLLGFIISMPQAVHAVTQMVDCTQAWDLQYKNPPLKLTSDPIKFEATCLQTVSGCPGFHDVVFGLFREGDPINSPYIYAICGGWDNTRTVVSYKGTNIYDEKNPLLGGITVGASKVKAPLNSAIPFTITLDKNTDTITVSSSNGYSCQFKIDAGDVKNIAYIGFTTWRTKMQYEVTGGIDASRPVNYYQMLEMRSEAYHQRPFWAWSGAGDAGKGPNPAGGPNTANHLLLIGENQSNDDNRSHEGAGLFFVRKAGSPDYRRNVNFGDTVEIVSPIDAYGYGQCFVRPSMWYAYNKNGVDNGGIVLTTDATNENATNGNQLFIIQSPTGAKGAVTENTPFVLYSVALKDEVYASNSSPWPNHHQVGLTADKADAKAKLFTFNFAHRTSQNGAQWDQAAVLSIFNTSPAMPQGFDQEAGWSTQITTGSKDGKVEAWCIGANYKRIYRFDVDAPDASPWSLDFEPQDQQGNPLGELEDISASSDGVLLVLAETGKVFKYNWDGKTFTALTVGADADLDLDVIAAGNQDSIWAVDVEAGALYQHDAKKGWILREGGDGHTVIVNVAAGIDGTVVIVDKNGRAYILDKANSTKDDLAWKELGDEDDGPIENIAAGDSQTIIATRKGSGTMLKWENNDWSVVTDANNKPTSGVDCVSTNAKGAAQFITDMNGNIFNRGEGGVAVAVKANGPKGAAGHPVTIKKVKAGPSARAAAKKAGAIKAPVKNTKASNQAAGKKPKNKKRALKAAKNAGKKAVVKKGPKKAKRVQKHVSKKRKKAHKPAPKPGEAIVAAPAVTTTSPGDTGSKKAPVKAKGKKAGNKAKAKKAAGKANTPQAEEAEAA